MDNLDFDLDVKALADDGVIEGLAVGYGNVDYGGDKVMPGAISESIMGRKALPMLLYHDVQRPAGVWTGFQETDEGLIVKGRFAMSTRDGKEAYGMTKDGALGALSMGYRVLKDKVIGKVRELHKVALHEVSLVTIGMNEKTLVSSVKAIRDILDGGGLPTVREFEDHLRDAGFSKSLSTALAAKAAPLLRGEPEAEDEAAFWEALKAA